jgi:predicted lipopolysaccharide heptosyltransferase III
LDSPGSERSILPSLPESAHILILRLRSIGDIILLTPALRLLKEWRPDLRVSVLVESRFRELLTGNPDVDEVLEIDSSSGIRNAASRLRLASTIRKRRPALCLNLHGGPTSALLTRWCGAKWKAGFAHFRRSSVYNLLIPDARTILNQPSIHTAEHQASALFWLGLPRRKIARARLAIAPADAEWWNQRLITHGIAMGRPYAVLHPTALYATKQWASENFARLGNFLENECNMQVIYSAGPGESGVLDEVEKSSGSRIRRLERIGLGRFAAVISRAALFVGNDSGPAHMAAALERPLVVIFGSSSSAIWGPWPREDAGGRARVVQNFYDCNPCPGDRCYRFERPECILSIAFDDVRKAVEAVLERPADRMTSGLEK